MAVWDHWQVSKVFILSISTVSFRKELNIMSTLSLLRYMEQVMKLNFVREAHVKKYKKLMKLDLPAELENLR